MMNIVKVTDLLSIYEWLQLSYSDLMLRFAEDLPATAVVLVLDLFSDLRFLFVSIDLYMQNITRQLVSLLMSSAAQTQKRRMT